MYSCLYALKHYLSNNTMCLNIQFKWNIIIFSNTEQLSRPEWSFIWLVANTFAFSCYFFKWLNNIYSDIFVKIIIMCLFSDRTGLLNELGWIFELRHSWLRRSAAPSVAQELLVIAGLNKTHTRQTCRCATTAYKIKIFFKAKAQRFLHFVFVGMRTYFQHA